MMNDVLDQIPELEEPLQLVGSPDDEEGDDQPLLGDDEEVFYDIDEYEELDLYGDPSDDDFEEEDDDYDDEDLDDFDEFDDEDDDADLDDLFGAPDEEGIEFYFEDDLTGEDPDEGDVLVGSPADYYPDDDDTIILSENQVFRHLDGVGLVAVEIEDLDEDDDEDFDEEIDIDPLTGAPKVKRRRRSRKRTAQNRRKRRNKGKRKGVRARNKRSGQRVRRTAKASGGRQSVRNRRRKAATRRAAAARRSGGVRVISPRLIEKPKRRTKVNKKSPRRRAARRSVVGRTSPLRRGTRGQTTEERVAAQRRNARTKGMSAKQKAYQLRKSQWKQFATKKKIDQMSNNPKARALQRKFNARSKARRIAGLDRRINNRAFTEPEKVMLRQLRQEATSGKRIPSVKRQTMLRTLRAIRKQRENKIVQSNPRASVRAKAYSRKVTARAVKKYDETKKPGFKKKIFNMIRRQKTTLYNSYQPFTAKNKKNMVKQADHFARASIGRAAERGQTEIPEIKSYVAKRIADGADMTPTPTLNVHYSPGEEKPDISDRYPGLMESLGVPPTPDRPSDPVPLPMIAPSVPLAPPPLPPIPRVVVSPLVPVAGHVTIPRPTPPSKPVPSLPVPTPIYPNTISTPPTNSVNTAVAVAVAVDKVAVAKTTKSSVSASNVVRFIQTI